MIKSIRDNYRIYGLIIVKTTKKSLVLDYGLSNATFETPNHDFTPMCSQFGFLNFPNMFPITIIKNNIMVRSNLGITQLINKQIIITIQCISNLSINK
jgi:hypothetical protein